MVKNACHPAGLNDRRLGEVKEEGIEQPSRTGDWEGPRSLPTPIFLEGAGCH